MSDFGLNVVRRISLAKELLICPIGEDLGDWGHGEAFGQDGRPQPDEFPHRWQENGYESPPCGVERLDALGLNQLLGSLTTQLVNFGKGNTSV